MPEIHQVATGRSTADVHSRSAVSGWRWLNLATLCLLVTTLAPAGEPLLRTLSGSFDPVAGLPTFAGELHFPAGDSTAQRPIRYYLVQMRNPVRSADVRWVTAYGGRVHAYVPDQALLVGLPPERVKTVTSGPGVRWLGRLQPGYRVAPALLGSHPDQIDVTLFAGETIDGFLSDLAHTSAFGAFMPTVNQLGTTSPTLGTALVLSYPQRFSDVDITAVANIEAVAFVEPHSVPRPVNDNTIWVGQTHDTTARTNYAVSATIWNRGILGTGQIAGVLDTGLDADNCFFKLDAAGTAPSQFLAPPTVGALNPTAKVVALYVVPGGDAYAGSGHGTATMGTVLGDNFATLSTPTIHGHDSADGLAPNARLVAQVPLGIAANLIDTFTQAYDSGARVHSNSWISAGNSYALACRQVDSFVWEHEDFVGVFGAGNSGGAPNNGAVAAPSVAKNNLSVAACSPGSQNDAEDLIDYSRGPAFDGRIKPDIVAPSGVATAGTDNTPGTNNCTIGGLGGTSASTPAIAGFAVLARQYFSDGFHPTGAANPLDARTPSAALVKSVLINSAVQILGTDPATSAPVDPIPSFNQGWGRPLLDDALYFPGDLHVTRVWDRWNPAGLTPGETDEVTIPVAAGQPLKVTLVWTDPPAASLAAVALVHDLDLEVEGPTGDLYRGNSFAGGESVLGGTADRQNNVEAVFLRIPPPGDYRVRVRAHDVPPAGVDFGDRQGYALVARFAWCDATLAAPLNPVATDLGASGISLAWDPVPGASAYTVYRADGPCAASGSETFLGEVLSPSLVDARTVGGYRYHYRIRTTNGCGESTASTCIEQVASSSCLLTPAFAGLASATVDGTHCAVMLQWIAGASRCPLAADLSYNVYRSTLPNFLPSPADLVATAVQRTTWVDTTVASAVTYFYVVRAEDGTTMGSGPANGGNEDSNLDRRNATADGPPGPVGTWQDDGGDTVARFALEPQWSVSTTENHTAAGATAYESGPPGLGYPAGACSAITSPDLLLDPAGSPSLSYWTRFNLESGWDGVVVELSTDGGGTWSDLPPDVGYPGDFSLSDNGSGGPANACLYPRAHGAFSGPAGNGGLSPWTAYATNLTAWAGSTARLRFQLSSDGGLEYHGFFVDDISVTDARPSAACVACPVAGPVGNTLVGVAISSVDLRFHWVDVAATGYRLRGSLAADLANPDVDLDASDGTSGAAHLGIIAEPGPRFYQVHALGDCGDEGP